MQSYFSQIFTGKPIHTFLDIKCLMNQSYMFNTKSTQFDHISNKIFYVRYHCLVLWTKTLNLSSMAPKICNSYPDAIFK